MEKNFRDQSLADLIAGGASVESILGEIAKIQEEKKAAAAKSEKELKIAREDLVTDFITYLEVLGALTAEEVKKVDIEEMANIFLKPAEAELKKTAEIVRKGAASNPFDFLTKELKPTKPVKKEKSLNDIFNDFLKDME